MPVPSIANQLRTTSPHFSVMDELGSQLWPIHLKPRHDELLSSWMIRLAHGHGYKSEIMLRMLFGPQHATWCRDIDKLAPEWLLTKIGQITGTAAERARRTTLSDYSGIVSEQIHTDGYCSWILPSYIYHRQRTRPGLMYCPSCLKSDEVPYFRRIWRLAFITACSDHGVNLLDAFPACGAAVIPHRVDMGPDALLPRDRSLTKCWKCGHDLRNAPTTSCTTDMPMFTKHLEGVVTDGFVVVAGNPTLHSVLYFAGLRILVRFAVRLCGLKRTHIELMPLTNRRDVMTEVAKLIASWPVNFLDALVQHKAKYSDLTGPRDTLPFWIEQCVHPLKRHQRADWTDEEIAEVARVIESRHGRLNDATARRKYGVYLPSERLPSHFRSTVSDDANETLMATLDQSVAATFDKNKRFGFLQDKVMFSLFRFTDLSTAAISGLRMTELEKYDIQSKNVGWGHAASSREDAFGRLQQHVQCERAKIGNVVDCPHVFVSPYTGRRLSDSTIQIRFQQAVQRAFLTAAIPSMRAYKLREIQLVDSLTKTPSD